MAVKRHRAKRRRRSRWGVKSVPVVHAQYRLEAIASPREPLGLTYIKGKSKVIKVNISQDQATSWAQTFWHEWFHGVHAELGYPEWNDEARVEGLSHAIMAFLVDPNGRALLKNMLRSIPEKTSEPARRK